MNHKYLFILSPPYQGSTVLYKLLHSSPAISTLISPDNPSHVGEGCALFHMTEEFHIENYKERRWDPDFRLPMGKVKNAYESLWDLKKPVLCDKSPPTIVRARSFEDYFSNFGDVYFIGLIRNPYACRYDISNWCHYAQFQKKNQGALKRIIFLNYEDLTSKIESTISRILDFLPELITLDSEVNTVAGIREVHRSGRIENKNRSINIRFKNKQIVENPDYAKLMGQFGYRMEAPI